MSTIDTLRAVNAVLALLTGFCMSAVTWRLAAATQWYEITARVGMAILLCALAYGSIESIQMALPFGFRTVGITAGLTTSALGFFTWRHHLPRRPLRRTQ